MKIFPKGELNVQLREQRKQRNWTQTQVADTLGVTDQTVGRWERGETIPPSYYMKKLCDLFETTPEALGMSKKATSLAATSDGKENDSKDEEQLILLEKSYLGREDTSISERIVLASPSPLPLECTPCQQPTSISRPPRHRLKFIELICLGLFVAPIIVLSLLRFFAPSLSSSTMAHNHPSLICFAQTCDGLFPHQTDGGRNSCLSSFQRLDWKVVWDHARNAIGTLTLYASNTCHTFWGSFLSNGFPFQRITISTIRRDPQMQPMSRNTVNSKELISTPFDGPMQGYDERDQTATSHIQIFARALLVDSHGVQPPMTNTDTFHLSNSLLIRGV